MRPPSSFDANPEPRQDEADFYRSAGLFQRVHGLESEITALQALVCHLLEKNECLRMRLHTCQHAARLRNCPE